MSFLILSNSYFFKLAFLQYKSIYINYTYALSWIDKKSRLNEIKSSKLSGVIL